MTSGNNHSAVQYLEVPRDLSGQRLDNYLQRELKGLPRNRIYRLLRTGEIRVNKGRVKPDYRVESGDIIRIPPMHLREQKAGSRAGPGLLKQLSDRILYESADMLVVNKPAGLAVHGGSGVKLGLIEALRQLRPDDKRLELVHRLDRDTSGCILLSRKRAALRELHRQFRDHEVQKVYQALAHGAWPATMKVVRAPLRRSTNPEGERWVKVDGGGQSAETRFTVLESYPDATLVQAEPVTGRTHQIRVHALHAGCPLFGDDRYGDREQNEKDRKRGLKRLFLHAHSLSFLSREGQQITATAPLDPILSKFLDKMDK